MQNPFDFTNAINTAFVFLHVTNLKSKQPASNVKWSGRKKPHSLFPENTDSILIKTKTLDDSLHFMITLAFPVQPSDATYRFVKEITIAI